MPGIPLSRSAHARPSAPATPLPETAGRDQARDRTPRSAASRALTAADYCLAALAGLTVILVTNGHYLLRQPYWLDEAWVADSVRAPLSLVPRLASSTPLGWTLLLRLVPFGGPERQRLVPLAFYALAVALAYLLGRELRLTRFTAGLLTAAAVLLAPSMLARGDLKQYTAEACAAVLVWLLVARAESAWSRWRLAAVAVTASAGCLFASTAIFTGAAAFACLGLECLLRRQWRRLAELAVAGAGALVIFSVIYVVVLRPRINSTLAYYWRPRYLPGNEANALSFLHVQLHQLTPYLAIAGRFGIGVDLIVGALAALGVAALAWMGRFALAALLPVTLAVTIVASAARVYPFGDQRTSTFWLVMVPVLMAIGIAAVIHAALRPRGGTSVRADLTRWVAALAATAVVVTVLATVNARWINVRAVAINPQNPYAQIAYVQAHFRPGDVIVVNDEATYAFAYYYPTPPGSYPASTVSANGFYPAYPNAPWIVALTNRDQRAIAGAVEAAVDMIAAEPPAHRGRIWVITDHVADEEAGFWRNALAGGSATTITLTRRDGQRPEPLLVYLPAIHPAAPAALWGASAGQWQRMLSVSTSR